MSSPAKLPFDQTPGGIATIVIICFVFLAVVLVAIYYGLSNADGNGSESTSSQAPSPVVLPTVSGTFPVTWQSISIVGTLRTSNIGFFYDPNIEQVTLTIPIVNFNTLSNTNGVIGFFCPPGSIPPGLLPLTTTNSAIMPNINSLLNQDSVYSADVFGSIRFRIINPLSSFTSSTTISIPTISFSYTRNTEVPNFITGSLPISFTGAVLATSPKVTTVHYYKEIFSPYRVALYFDTIIFTSGGSAGSVLTAIDALAAAQVNLLPASNQTFVAITTNWGALIGVNSATASTALFTTSGTVALTSSTNFPINSTTNAFTINWPELTKFVYNAAS